MLNIQNLTELFPYNLAREYLHKLSSTPALLRRGWDSRRQLIHFGKRLHEQFFVSATDGNLSVRLDEQTILATPTGLCKGMMLAKDLVVIDLAGNRLKGCRKVSSEIDMHLMIYRRRPDICAIIHAHPCTATGFASAGLALNEPLCSELLMTLGEVPLAPYGTPGTIELSEALLPFVPKHNAVLMANHGVVAYGKTLLEAYQRLEAVEHFARIVLVTHLLGQKRLLSEADIEKLLVTKKQ